MELLVEKTATGCRWVELERESSGLLGSLGITDPDGATHDPKTEKCGPHSVVIPFMRAAADSGEKWWKRLRGSPKRAGEISQAAFLLKAEMMGFHVALPWGDSERYDFVVWGRAGAPVMRVQVKGTGRLYRKGYEVQPVHSTRKGGKKRYTKRDIDVIAAHVQPEDAWYLIPIEKVGRAKSLRLYPDREGSGIHTVPKSRRVGQPGSQRVRRPQRHWEHWRNAWDVLGPR